MRASHVGKRRRPFTFWRVLPIVGEAANCYFSRLTMDECDHRPRLYAKEIDIAQTFDSEELLEHISRLPISEGDKARLSYWTPIERNRSFHFAGQSFRPSEFQWTRRVECRECVAEVPYHRVWWHLECFRTCPVHGSPLELVRNDELSLVGRWWPRFERAVPERLPDVALGEDSDTIEGWIVRSLMGSEREVVLGCLLPRTGDGHLAPYRTVGNFVEAAEFVGRLLGNERSISVPPFSVKDSEVGYQNLKGGVGAFRAHLRKWMERNRERGFAWRPGDLVGWAADYLAEGDFDPEIDETPSALMRQVSGLIREECGRVLGR
ncbi:hypothetical protein HJB93_28770 [Rhizobium sp. NLR12b]|nr:hypothetical protein [Rhizobium sp. NLR12b]